MSEDNCTMTKRVSNEMAHRLIAGTDGRMELLDQEESAEKCINSVRKKTSEASYMCYTFEPSLAIFVEVRISAH